MDIFMLSDKIKFPPRLKRVDGVHIPMLAFDIETMGLDARRHAVTVVCTEDFHSGIKKSYAFARLRWEHARALQFAHKTMQEQDLADADKIKAEHDALVVELVQDLEEAASLCAFNGVRFDLPFLQTAFGIDTATLTRWVMKTSDILECSRLEHGNTFSLNLLCQKNGLDMKISSGLAAVQMAIDGEWCRLNAYCADDVSILCRLYRMQTITHPRSDLAMPLERWSRPGLFAAKSPESAEKTDHC